MTRKILIVITTLIVQIIALKIHIGCATIQYDPKVYPSGTIKEVRIIPDKGVRVDGYLMCNNSTWIPTIKNNTMIIKFLYLKPSFCELILICNNSKVIAQRLTFIESTPVISFLKVYAISNLHVTFRACFPLKADYRVFISALGISREIVFDGSGCITRSLLLPIENIPQTPMSIPIYYVIYANSTLLTRGEERVKVEVIAPSIDIQNSNLVAGTNKICFSLSNPSNVTMKNIEIIISIPYSNATTLVRRLEELHPYESSVICTTVNVSPPPMFMSNTTGTLNTPKAIVHINYSIGTERASVTKEFDVNILSVAWPGPSLIATDPLVPQTGSMFKLVAYINNPSLMTFYNVKVFFISKNGTILIPLTQPVRVIPMLSPMSSLPVTFYYKLSKCSRYGDIEGILVIEAQVFGASNVRTFPVSLPARCTNGGFSADDATVKGNAETLSRLTLVEQLLVLLLFLAAIVLLVVLFKKYSQGQSPSTVG